MKRKICIAMLAVVLAVSLSSPLFAGKTKRPHPSKLKYDPLELTTPSYEDIELSSGMTGFIVEDHEIPVVNVTMLVKTYFPDQSKYGLNEMAWWVLRNGGSEKWPSDKMNEELEFLAAYIEVGGGGGDRVTVRTDEGNLGMTISLNCLKKDLPRVLGIYSDIIMNPAFPEDKIEMKRKTMLEELRRKNDEPRQIVRREFYKVIYTGHPYQWEGTAEGYEAITRDDLIAFHGAYFHPNNVIIGVSGDVTKDEIIGELEKAFAGWEQADVAIPEVPPLPENVGPSWNYAYKEINQAYIRIGHVGINANNPDRCAITIMNHILGGGSFTSWITERVRSDEGLAYSTGSRYNADPWIEGAFFAYAQTKLEAYSRAIQLIFEQFERMRTEGPTEEEFEKAVDSYLNSQVFDYESKSDVMERLVQLRFQGRPLDTPEKDMETYAKLTVDDIRRVAEKYLHPDKMAVVVIGDASKFDRPLSDFGAVNEIELEE
jgi:predicted Zn-dependent peptidase